MADDPHTPPCKLVVEPGDLLNLVLRQNPDLRRGVLIEAMAMGLMQTVRRVLDSEKDPPV